MDKYKNYMNDEWEFVPYKNKELPKAQNGLMSWLNAASYGVGSAASFAGAGMDTTGALLDSWGTMNINNQVKQWENNNARQFAFNKAENLPPIEQYGYQFQGRNSALMRDGGSIKKIGGQGLPNVEIEDKENVTLNSGLSENVSGKTHSEGGIPLNLEVGAKVLSEKLKHPETGKSFANMAKKLQTKKDFKHAESKFSDDVNKSTADLNISLKNQELDKLFLDQETRKINGDFGKKVKEATLDDYKMKFGGLTKAGNGKFQTFSTKNNKITETGADVTTDPPTEQDWQNTIIPSWYNYSEGNLPYLTDSSNYGFSKFIPKNLQTNEALLQEVQYDSILDRLDPNQNFSQAERDEALNQMKNVWGKIGRVTFNSKDKYSKPNIDSWKAGDKATYEELAKLRGNFIDSKLEKRHFTPIKKQVPATAPTAKSDLSSDLPSKIDAIKGNGNYGNLKFQNPNITALSLDTYQRDPITSYTLDPQYVHPRYLDINPELNDINRDVSTGLSYVTDRSGNSLANVSNMLNQARAAKQRAYGSKYQYDRQQDQWAEGTNAKTKMDIDSLNLNNYINNVRNPILQREATITQQKLMENNAQIKAQVEKEHEQAVKDYLAEIYNPSYALNENYTPKKKYRGKVKIKKKK